MPYCKDAGLGNDFSGRDNSTILTIRPTTLCETGHWKTMAMPDLLQAAFDAGAKRLLLPMASVGDIPSIPGELFAKFQTGFYADPRDAVFKALGAD